MLDLSTLGEYLQKNPQVMEKRTLLQGILRDIFPQDRLAVNLLLIGFDEEIFSLVGTNPSGERLAKLVRTIADNHGVGEQNAVYIVETWMGVVFGESLPPGFGSQAEKPGEFLGRLRNVFGPSGFNMQAAEPKAFASPAPLQSNRKLSVADVREVFFRTKGKLMRKCKFRSVLELETWDVVDKNSNSHYSRNLTRREKGLIIRRLGKGLYQEQEFAYIRTSTDMAHAWGLTYDSLILATDTEAVIPFEEIEHVESERGLFTDTMTIALENGVSYELDEHEMMATPLHDNLSDLAGFLNVIKDM